jgi:REP element-mobilizing transposase RayT
MARKLRIEYEGALYHVISRGNYRADVFGDDTTKAAFEQGLFEACEKTRWRLHAYVMMRNHYHLALETPEPNLVAGMRWLQSTFANRFNRFRRERGHVFQGRYHAIVVEDGRGLGAVCHYIHLNPVRAGAAAVAQLEDHRFGSFHWLMRGGERPACLEVTTALDSAGGLRDTPEGRRAYREYLAWLSTEEPAQKALGFEHISRGWALGTKGFKRALAADERQARTTGMPLEAETAEVRTLRWERLVEQCVRRLGKSEAAIAADRKAADWKVAVAAHLKATTTVTNPWLSEQLRMGDPDGVSRYCSECRAGRRPAAAALLKEISDIRV